MTDTPNATLAVLADAPNTLQAKQDVNRLAYHIAVEVTSREIAVQMSGGGKADPVLFSRYERDHAALHKTAVALAMIAPAGSVVMTDMGEMIVAERREDGQVLLSQDGQPMVSKWYNGPSDDREQVYVERYSERGREFHGWIDAVHRTIVQTG